MTKKEIRRELLLKRKHIENRNEKTLLINQELFHLLKDYDVIGAYAYINDEVNIDDLITQLLSINKTVVLPMVNGDNIEFFSIKSLDELSLEKSKYHIREPINLPNRLINKNKINVIIVPGVGFDKDNNRIGYGKGYYDRFLSDYKGVKIGVCYQEQIVDHLPNDINDIKMTSIISK